MSPQMNTQPTHSTITNSPAVPPNTRQNQTMHSQPRYNNLPPRNWENNSSRRYFISDGQNRPYIQANRSSGFQTRPPTERNNQFEPTYATTRNEIPITCNKCNTQCNYSRANFARDSITGCLAYNKTCFKCNRLGHFANMCNQTVANAPLRRQQQYTTAPPPRRMDRSYYQQNSTFTPRPREYQNRFPNYNNSFNGRNYNRR